MIPFPLRCAPSSQLRLYSLRSVTLFSGDLKRLRTKLRHGGLGIVVLPLLLILAGCGGGSSSSPVVIRVQVSPSQINVKASGSQLFQASVTGTSNHAVLWQVDGVTGGSVATGMIDATGIYTAPDDIPSPATVTITAISQADSTKSASATATITIGVVVLPTTASLNVSSPQCTATQQFSVNVSGTSNSVVDWSVNGIAAGSSDATFGTITTSGLYTSPAAIPTPPSFKVTAISQADSSQSGNSVVTISAGGAAVNQATQGAPIQLGTSGGNAKDKSSNACCSGTLGALVVRNGVHYLLSNNHVLAREDGASVGEAIVQPGLVDSSCSPATPVAHFSQAVKLQNSNKTAVADAALAQVVTGEVDPSGAILQLGAVSCGVAQPAPPASTVIAPAVNMPVAKSGRSTGLTCGAISLIDASLKVQYTTTCGSSSTFTVTFNHQVVINSSTFGAPGDSGALIVDSQTAQPVALLVGGDSSTGITVANPIQDVLDALSDPSNQALPAFVGGATHPVSACASSGSNRTMSGFPHLSSAELQRALMAKNAHLAGLVADPSVLGVGIGTGETSSAAAIVVLVQKGKTHRSIPASLDDVPVRVRSIGVLRAFGAPSCSSHGAKRILGGKPASAEVGTMAKFLGN